MLLLAMSTMLMHAQSIHVEIVADLNASGGVTYGPEGNIYISDFGPKLGLFDQQPTNVYRWNLEKDTVELFAEGFSGASGACFDGEGNFFQSNPFGHKISKIHPDGSVIYDWASDSLLTPVGLVADGQGNVFVSNCGKNEIGKIDAEGNYMTYAKSDLFKCPNGLTQDPKGNLFACNFGDGKVLRIDTDGLVSTIAELPELKGGPSPVGNGHLVYSNGWLYVSTIGTGEIYRVGLGGGNSHVVGLPMVFRNTAGTKTTASFSKPNGIAASVTGDTLYVNVSEPTWVSDPAGLHPGRLMRITGICGLPDSGCE